MAITSQALLSRQTHPLAYVLILAFLALFGFVTVSGLIFVDHPTRTAPIVAALALQIPWVSSPIIAYKFAAGFQVSAALIGGRFNGGFRLGSDFQINILQPLPWGVGINLFAVGLLILVLRETRMTADKLQPTMATPGISAPPANSASSPPPG